MEQHERKNNLIKSAALKWLFTRDATTTTLTITLTTTPLTTTLTATLTTTTTTRMIKWSVMQLGFKLAFALSN